MHLEPYGTFYLSSSRALVVVNSAVYGEEEAAPHRRLRTALDFVYTEEPGQPGWVFPRIRVSPGLPEPSKALVTQLLRARIQWRHVYLERAEQTHPSLPTHIHIPYLLLLEPKRRLPEARDLTALTLGPCTVPGIQQLLGSSHSKGSAAETGRGNMVNTPPHRQIPINMQMCGLISSSYFPIQSQQPRR